jgi:glutathione peroxidase
MFAKIAVNGADAHPLYRWLKHEAPGLLGTEGIKWNFTKFLVARRSRAAPLRAAGQARGPGRGHRGGAARA